MLRLRIREVAEAKGISRTRLARLADMNYKTINLLWKNPYREVTSTSLNQIAAALDIPATELLEDVPEDRMREEMKKDPEE